MGLPTDKLDPNEHKWLNSHGVRSVMAAIQAGGGLARVVGGAVRDALLGREVRDIDFAVNLPPEEVMRLLKTAGIKVVATGLAHGTVTAVVEGKGYELTTLRHDVETDGRHAKVAYTTDWKADAARRDFTFNAMYLDENNCIVDHFDGRSDLASRRIRFIGDPDERIQEDYLRVLRAFRFMAQIGTPECPAFIEEQSLSACCKFAGALTSLSAERLWHELHLLLSSKNPVPACKLMIVGGVLPVLLPPAKRIDRLARLIKCEEIVAVSPSALRRLAALWDGEGNLASKTLRFSKREQAHFCHLAQGVFDGVEDISLFVVRQKLYDLGKDVVKDGILLRASEVDLPLSELLHEVDVWSRPIFPLRGKDLIGLGFTKGPEIGKTLFLVEEWWRAKDFMPLYDDCKREVLRRI